MLFSWGCQSGHQKNPQQDPGPAPSGAAVSKGLSDLKVLMVDGSDFIQLPSTSPSPVPNPPPTKNVLVFKYFVAGSDLTMKGWLYREHGVVPHGGPTPSPAIQLVAGINAGLSVQNMYLGVLNLGADGIADIKRLLNPNPGDKWVLFTPYSRQTIMNAPPNTFPANINTDDGFAWVISIIDKILFEKTNKTVDALSKAATQSSATFNPSPPKELAQ